jgi:tetratricopeptide (TPR) repeat protein
VRRLIGAVLLAAACGGGVNHESLGDAAFAEGEFVTALQEYRAAIDDRPAAETWLKLAAAALKTGDHREATEGFQRAVALDSSSAEEAARGLALVAAAAEREGDEVGLRLTVRALRSLAPERVKSRQTLTLLRGGELDPEEAAGLGPLALAAAGDAAATDQALLGYGEALRRTTACGEAVPVYQAALRRSRDRQLRRRAIDGLGSCGLQLGSDALLVKRPEEAARWFGLVVEADSASRVGRQALIGLGDAQVMQGEILAATMAYESAIRLGGEDSLRAVATERLAGLVPAPDPESVP